jgi:hypothetical protein
VLSDEQRRANLWVRIHHFFFSLITQHSGLATRDSPLSTQHFFSTHVVAGAPLPLNTKVRMNPAINPPMCAK